MKSGYTLIEATLYIAISSLVVISVLSFFSQILAHRNKLEVSSAPITDAMFVSQKIDYVVKNGYKILKVSSNSLCVQKNDFPLAPAKRIYQSGDQIRISDGLGWFSCNWFITFDDDRLTSNLSSVESLTFVDVSKSGLTAIKYEMKFKQPVWMDTTELVGGNSSYSFSSTAVIRSW